MGKQKKDKTKQTQKTKNILCAQVGETQTNVVFDTLVQQFTNDVDPEETRSEALKRHKEEDRLLKLQINALKTKSLNMSKRANKGEKKQLTKVCQKLKDYVEQRHQQDLLRFEQEEKEEKESKEAMTEEKEQKPRGKRGRKFKQTEYFDFSEDQNRYDGVLTSMGPSVKPSALTGDDMED